MLKSSSRICIYTTCMALHAETQKRPDMESSSETGVSKVHNKAPEVPDHISSRDEGKQ
jgi:hypothetical protein